MARFSAFVERQHVGKWHEKDIFEKPVGNGWILRKIAHAQVEAPPGNGCYWDEHQLVGPRLMQKIACQRWEWAELDGERLVWASEGKLCSAHIQNGRLVNEADLYDFNEMTFTAMEAPY